MVGNLQKMCVLEDKMHTLLRHIMAQESQQQFKYYTLTPIEERYISASDTLWQDDEFVDVSTCWMSNRDTIHIEA